MCPRVSRPGGGTSGRRGRPRVEPGTGAERSMADARVLHRIVLLSLIAGLLLSIFAALEVLAPGLRSVCSVNAFFSCSAVDQSGLTSIDSVPDWLIGVAGFVLMLAIDIPLLLTFRPRLLYALLLVSVGGLLVAAYLAYVELVLIRALCPVCLGAYIADAAVVGLAASLVWMQRRAAEPQEGEATAGSGPAERTR